MINSEEVIKHLDGVIAGLEGIKNSLKGEKREEKKEESNEVKTEKIEIDTQILADRLANSYTTLHPEYRIESQYRNLQEMANNSDKISILFSWLRRHSEGIEDFFRLPQATKKEILNVTLSKHSDLIKQILSKRFSS